MFKLSAGLVVFLAAASVGVLYTTPVLGTPNYFIGLLAIALAVVGFGAAVSASSSVSSRSALLAWGATAVAIAVFAVGLISSLVVDGRVVSPTSPPARAAAQISDIDRDARALQDASTLFAATPAEQFARAGQARRLADRCAELNRQWDRTAPADQSLIPAIVALKEGAADCSKGATVVGQASATPDEKTVLAVQQARSGVDEALVRIQETVHATESRYHLPGGSL